MQCPWFIYILKHSLLNICASVYWWHKKIAIKQSHSFAIVPFLFASFYSVFYNTIQFDAIFFGYFLPIWFAEFDTSDMNTCTQFFSKLKLFLGIFLWLFFFFSLNSQKLRITNKPEKKKHENDWRWRSTLFFYRIYKRDHTGIRTVIY